MLYIFGKNIPKNKSINYALTNIFGINKYTANQICQKMGFNPTVNIQLLNRVQIKKLIKWVESSYSIEQDLKKTIFEIKKNLITKKMVRGLRNARGLPVRGQRTHTNAKTKKHLKNKI